MRFPFFDGVVVKVTIDIKIKVFNRIRFMGKKDMFIPVDERKSFSCETPSVSSIPDIRFAVMVAAD